MTAYISLELHNREPATRKYRLPSHAEESYWSFSLIICSMLWGYKQVVCSVLFSQININIKLLKGLQSYIVIESLLFYFIWMMGNNMPLTYSIRTGTNHSYLALHCRFYSPLWSILFKCSLFLSSILSYTFKCIVLGLFFKNIFAFLCIILRILMYFIILCTSLCVFCVSPATHFFSEDNSWKWGGDPILYNITR